MPVSRGWTDHGVSDLSGINAACRQLLANLIMEEYSITLKTV